MLICQVSYGVAIYLRILHYHITRSVVTLNIKRHGFHHSQYLVTVEERLHQVFECLYNHHLRCCRDCSALRDSQAVRVNLGKL